MSAKAGRKLSAFAAQKINVENDTLDTNGGLQDTTQQPDLRNTEVSKKQKKINKKMKGNKVRDKDAEATDKMTVEPNASLEIVKSSVSISKAATEDREMGKSDTCSSNGSLQIGIDSLSKEQKLKIRHDELKNKVTSEAMETKRAKRPAEDLSTASLKQSKMSTSPGKNRSKKQKTVNQVKDMKDEIAVEILNTTGNSDKELKTQTVEHTKKTKQSKQHVPKRQRRSSDEATNVDAINTSGVTDDSNKKNKQNTSAQVTENSQNDTARSPGQSRNKTAKKSKTKTNKKHTAYSKVRDSDNSLERKKEATEESLLEDSYKEFKEASEIIEVESDSSVICIGDSSSEEKEGDVTIDIDRGEGTDQEDNQLEESQTHLDLEPSDLSWYAEKVEGGVLVILQHPSEYVIKGMASVRMLAGHVDIQGYHLKPDIPATVYSPECNSRLTMKTVQSETSVIKAMAKLSVVLSFSKTKVKEAMESFGSFVAFHVKRVELSFCDVIAQHYLYKRLFEPDRDQSGLNKKLAHVGVSLTSNEDMPSLKITEDLDRILKLWAGDASDIEGKMPMSLLVCGGKDSGKSTTNRLLLNTALNSANSSGLPLYYLDCDVGQAEFTPAGCVSLVKVTHPLLGPAFCNQREPVYSCCFHGITARDDPDRYLACVRQCMDRYRQLEKPGRLVINTMGWMTGLGFQLLVDIVRLAQPECIVQLTAHRRHENIPALTPEFMDKTSWSDLSRDRSCKRVARNRHYKPHSLIHIEVPVAPGNMSKYRPSDYRNFSLLGHLCHDLDPGLTLTSVQPYSIHWWDIAVHVCGSGVPREQVMYALNASLVALCHADISKAKQEINDGPMFFRRLPVCEWIGYGIVRGVDPDRRLLYVVTPLSLDKLCWVNTIVKGSVTIPDQLLLAQGRGRLPYVDESRHSVGAASVKPRRHMPRKGLGPKKS